MTKHATMNRIYRLVWGQTSQAWVVMAEYLRRQGGRSNRRLLTAALSAGVAFVGPARGQILAGSGCIAHSGNTATIVKSSPTLTLPSRSFSIGPQQRVEFVQPSSSAPTINRILSNNGTALRLGTSDGRSGYQ